MNHEKSYIFARERQAKRRCVESSGLDSSWHLRERTYRELWSEEQRRVNEVLENANRATLDDLIKFLKDAGDIENRKKSPCGMILAGPSIAAHASLFDQLSQRITAETSSSFVLLTSVDAPNLKTLLKAIIKGGISRRDADEEDVEMMSSVRRGPKLLSYDLQLLYEWVSEKHVEQVVVAFRDTEAFDSNVLSEALELLGIWSNRIPFVFLFGIATSIGNLQDRLTQSAVRYLEGRQFDVVQAGEILEQIFFATTASQAASLRLGAQLSQMLLERHKEHLQSVQDFTDALQYAYMAHFFANPLSVFLCKSLQKDDISKEHLEALRNLPSFRNFSEGCLLKPEKVAVVRKLLESDETLFDFVIETIPQTQDVLASIGRGVHIFDLCQMQISKSSPTPRSALFVKALAGQLADAPILRELLLSVKRAPSDVLREIVTSISTNLPSWDGNVVGDIYDKLQRLLSQNGNTQEPLRSEHDIRNDTLRTTVIAQKVQLSRHKSNLSEKDTEYSKLINQFHEWLEIYFEKTFVDPKTLPFHEIVLYDLRVPHRAAFTPKTRHAVERALYSPHDYLNCKCCAPTSGERNREISLTSTQPATALLYHLYCESGTLTNINDLWSAFSAILDDDGNNSEADQIMPLFQRALAELKYLGLVKGTRKKTDHIAKVAWRGL